MTRSVIRGMMSRPRLNLPNPKSPFDYRHSFSNRAGFVAVYLTVC